MTVETLGIDIAKNVFQLHRVNHHGCVVLKRRVMRDQFLDIVAQVERCTIVVEACTGAFCWARKFEALGHQVKIISPQYVKPFVRRHKNDGNDAEAICTAARQPHIPLVPKKTVEQQDIQALHRSRQRMVNHRTAVVSQIRGLLLDRGFAIAKSITRARRLVPEILSDLENELTPLAREAIAELHDLFRDLDRRICRHGQRQHFALRLYRCNAGPEFKGFRLGIVAVSMTIVARPDFTVETGSSHRHSICADWHVVRQAAESELARIAGRGGYIDR